MVNSRKYAFLVLGLVLVFGVAAILGGCGSSSSANSMTNSPPPMGTVSTSVSDPPTCQAPNGPYSHVYVTVTDVKASTSSDPNAPDSGFVDLTPGLKPTQIDLLGQPNGMCLLATLGVNTQIPAGTYEQFRVILLANSQFSQVPNNQCGNAANCVVLAATSAVETLQLSSEAQTGIKIPSSQIAGGRFMVPANQTADLVIDFNACASVVIQGNGQYRLKPVLHAGEVSATASTIKGVVLDSVTMKPLAGGTVMVALEQNQNGIDRVIMQTDADANGNFAFCPVADGTYDVVAVGIDGQGVAYAATVTTGVMQGTSMGNVLLTASTMQASLQGQVTTSTGTAGTVADLSVSALQPISNSVQAIIPLVQQGSATASLTTAPGAGCPANTDCVSYTLGVPAVNPNVGPVGGPWAPFGGGTVNYSVDALAFVPMSGSTPDCTPSELTTNMTTANTPLTVTPGATVNPATLVFTGCQ